MSLINFANKSPFLIRKTTPRKTISRSPFKLSGADLAREFGPRYQIVDVRIGQQRMVLDIVQGSWIPEEETNETAIGSRDMVVLEKRKRQLEKDNDILRVKLDILLEMLAEVTAEEQLQQTSNK